MSERYETKNTRELLTFPHLHYTDMYTHDKLKEKVERLSFNSTGSQFHAQRAKENALSTIFTLAPCILGCS